MKNIWFVLVILFTFPMFGQVQGKEADKNITYTLMKDVMNNALNKYSINAKFMATQYDEDDIRLDRITIFYQNGSSMTLPFKGDDGKGSLCFVASQKKGEPVVFVHTQPQPMLIIKKIGSEANIEVYVFYNEVNERVAKHVFRR